MDVAKYYQLQQQLVNKNGGGSAPAGKESLSQKDAEINTLKNHVLSLEQERNGLKEAVEQAEAALDQLAHDKYPELSEDEVKTLVIVGSGRTRPATRTEVSSRGEEETTSPERALSMVD